MKFDVNDIVGERFGKLVVIKFDHKVPHKIGTGFTYYYLCQCDCGNRKIINRNALKNINGTKSCGCLLKNPYVNTIFDVNDIVGKRFYRWTVVGFHHSKNLYLKDKTFKGKDYYYLCRCDCGTEKLVLRRSLLSGTSKSCNCLKTETASKINLKHHLYNHPLHSVWSNLKQRCYNPNNKRYVNYGARGIKVCDEWLNDYKIFYNWSMDNGYKDNLTIDRIDNDGNYEPSNCRWTTFKTQNRNTRFNHLETYKGDTHCIAEWAEILKVKDNFLRQKLSKGYSFQEIVQSILQC